MIKVTHMPKVSIWLSGIGLLMLLTSPLTRAETPPVTVVTPVIADLSETLTLSGSLTAEKQAMLSPRMDGLVKEVLVDAGYEVKQGDVLLRLDPAISEQQLKQAKASTREADASVLEARRLVQEAQRLRGENYISATELANREANLALAEAAFAAAKANENTRAEELRRHVLPAPFNGVISAKMTEAGEWVNRGDQVLELVAVDRVRLDVNAPQEQFSSIREGSTVTVFPDARPGEQLTGKIAALVPVSNAQARSFLVRILLDENEAALLPGTSATAEIKLQRGALPGLSIPRDAVFRHPDGGRSVFVIDEDNKAVRKHVKVSQEDNRTAIITTGITQQDRVVLRGNEVLQNGVTVRIVEDRE
ncbi:efflux RND transporter periplasmic adaptor subunit [Methylophaga sp. OBS3]|uniref:efflux RND transporter periplasmic adaptor subunit n=1 Tax=Methylophaga sp. OBS3 TaxID=2991934 RepID=UPI0022508D70|nr:efflux RND transporter periplasmic adaptor subunit [Methylophaga sp. OBS3]MCX4189776.1 efflux RND transporter periplasmic adaptor subunit [Methylophaga sp. OBS3]